MEGRPRLPRATASGAFEICRGDLQSLLPRCQAAINRRLQQVATSTSAQLLLDCMAAENQRRAGPISRSCAALENDG
jgi:hypothetical protein